MTLLASIENEFFHLKVSPIGMSVVELRVKSSNLKDHQNQRSNDEKHILTDESLGCLPCTKNTDSELQTCPSESFSPILQIIPEILMIPSENQSFNCVVGRYANRIENGTFCLNRVTHHLVKNWKTHFLHGCIGKTEWGILEENDKNILGKYFSKDLEDGFPCDVTITCNYTLQSNKIVIDLQAFNHDQIRSTPISLTHHMYWNLSGTYEDIFQSHSLWINASYYTELQDEQITTGQILKVSKELDFSKPKPIGRDLSKTFSGYDHNYILNTTNRDSSTGLILAAVLTHLHTNRCLKVYTTLPGLQVYTGNNLKGQKTIEGHALQPGQGICLEPQFFPNSVNHEHFPSTLVGGGGSWKHQIIFEICL